MVRALLLVLLLLSLPARASGPRPIRVALKLGVATVRVSGGGGLSLKPPDGSRVLARVRVLSLEARGGQVRAGRQAYGPGLLVVPRLGRMRVDGAPYRGYLVVTATRDKLQVVDVLGLESYVASVLGAEISPRWPRATLRAQAVASRSYAYFMMSHPRGPGYDVAATVLDQLYLGMSRETASTRRAAADTRGLVLVNHKQEVLKAFFCSNCGGHTEDSWLVFHQPHPHLVGVVDPFCRNAPNSHWTVTFTAAQFRRAFARAGLGLGRLQRAVALNYDRSGRIGTFLVTDEQGVTRRVPGTRLRKILGPRKLKSTLCKVFTVGSPIRKLVFRGSGWGHGVGLCQWGAREMGVLGYSFRKILEHYYPGSRLVQD